MTAQRISLQGFSPDLPSDAPGNIISSTGCVPTVRGIRVGWAEASTTRGTQGDLGTAAYTGAYQARVPSGTYYYYVGTTAKLWESNAGGSTLTDRSATTYNSTDTNDGAWSFAQFGTETLAVNKFDTLQAAATGSSAFAAVSGAPKASIVVTVGEPTAPFAMTFNYNDGTDTPDGVFWSALADYTDWTPSIATECGNVRIFENAGPFTAAIKYRDGVLAWKDNSMYVGTYVGGSAVWSFQRISSDIGCGGKHLVVAVNDIVYFADQHAIWKYDGSYPQPLPGAVHDYWARFIWPVSGGTNASRHQMVWDSITHTLHIKVGGTGVLTWNAISGMWLKGAMDNLLLAVRPSQGVCTVISTDSSTSHNFITAIAENAGAGKVTIGYFGDPIAFTQLKRVAPVWLTNQAYSAPPAGTTCTAIAWPSMPVDDGILVGSGSQAKARNIALDATSRYFDMNISGNYLEVALTLASAAEFRDIVIDAVQSGTA